MNGPSELARSRRRRFAGWTSWLDTRVDDFGHPRNWRGWWSEHQGEVTVFAVIVGCALVVGFLVTHV